MWDAPTRISCQHRLAWWGPTKPFESAGNWVGGDAGGKSSRGSSVGEGSGEGVEKSKTIGAGAADPKELFARAQRQRLPDERASTTHKFSVGGSEGYITVGMYEDGRPGEVFIKMSKEGSTLSGVMDGLALTLSIGLQYGVPLKVLVDKLINTRFEPSGFTENPQIRFASSLLDYVGRWLGGKFISSSYLKLSTDTDGGAENATPGPVQTTT